MIFERLAIEQPNAVARGWVADRDGIYDDARRGFGGQSRTAERVFEARAFDRCRIFGWVTGVRSFTAGASRPAINALLAAMERAGACAIGLLVLPDDDAFVDRLTRHYARSDFELFDEEPYGEGTRSWFGSRRSDPNDSTSQPQNSRGVGTRRPRMLGVKSKNAGQPEPQSRRHRALT